VINFTTYLHLNLYIYHPASYPLATRCSYTGGKVAGAWSWPFTSL